MGSEQDSAQEPRFRSDMTVELVKHCAADSDVVWAARVSTVGEQSIDDQRSPEQSQGLINYLMRDRHGSPFEHSSMTFLVIAPIFVFREFHRHRVGWSYNEESGRYRELAPVFYTPAADRKLIQQGRPGKYHFVEGTAEQLQLTSREIVAMGVVEEVVPEPKGSASADYDAAAQSLDEALYRHMKPLLDEPPSQLLQHRYDRFRYIDSLIQAEPHFGPKID